MTKSRLLGMLLLSVAIVSAASYTYLFRERSAQTGPGEVSLFRWRWGALKEVLVDFDSDGKYDFHGVFAGWSPDASPDDPFARAWGSSACDGSFDVEFDYDPSGALAALKLDTDGDGEPELHLNPDSGFQRMAETCTHWERWIPQR